MSFSELLVRERMTSSRSRVARTDNSVAVRVSFAEVSKAEMVDCRNPILEARAACDSPSSRLRWRSKLPSCFDVRATSSTYPPLYALGNKHIVCAVAHKTIIYAEAHKRKLCFIASKLYGDRLSCGIKRGFGGAPEDAHLQAGPTAQLCKKASRRSLRKLLAVNALWVGQRAVPKGVGLEYRPRTALQLWLFKSKRKKKPA
jgi:hypothetical protein